MSHVLTVMVAQAFIIFFGFRSESRRGGGIEVSNCVGDTVICVGVDILIYVIGICYYCKGTHSIVDIYDPERMCTCIIY